MSLCGGVPIMPCTRYTAMNRRELIRLAGIGTVAAAAPAREFPAGYDASKELARPDWKPLFFDAHQNDTVVALSDLIIPATDTPGAKEAQVNRFIDELLAAESRDTQKEFLNALAFLDGEAQERYRTAFTGATPEQQIELLSYLAYPQSLETWPGVRSESPAHQHFRTLKEWVSRAYYSSEIGQRELGYNDEFPHGEMPGCTKH